MLDFFIAFYKVSSFNFAGKSGGALHPAEIFAHHRPITGKLEVVRQLLADKIDPNTENMPLKQSLAT